MNQKGHPVIFIVEDNKAYSKIIEHHLKTNQYHSIYTFSSGEECLQNLYLKPDIIIQDYKLQGINGISVLLQYKKTYPHCEFIFLSGQDDIPTAVNAIKAGAFDFIVKTDNAMALLVPKIEDVIRLQKHERKIRKRYNVLILSIIALFILAGILILSNRIFLY